MEIKVLGTGCCSKCAALMKATEAAMAELGIDSEVEEITDIEKIISYNVMRTPALVVNGKVLFSGKALGMEEVKSIIKAQMQ